jgi:4,5-DOPA dioxygenase extradiol
MFARLFVVLMLPWTLSQDSELCTLYRRIGRRLKPPNRILVVSAHWEEDVYKVTSSPMNFLSYDYFGYPDHVYDLKYAPPGDVFFAKKVWQRQ